MKIIDNRETQLEIKEYIKQDFLEVWSTQPKLSKAIGEILDEIEQCISQRNADELTSLIAQLQVVKRLTCQEYLNKLNTLKSVRNCLHEEYTIQIELLISLINKYEGKLTTISKTND